MRVPYLLQLVGFGVVSVGCSAPPEHEIVSTEQSVINGTTVAETSNESAVALYHGGERPCSAAVLNSLGWVLTATHCLTEGPAEEWPTRPLKAVSSFKVVRRVSPGPTVPSDALSVVEIRRHPFLDMSLVRAPGLQTRSGLGSPFYFAPSSELFGRTVVARGFGHYSLAAFAVNDNSLTGVLREAVLTVSTTYGSEYTMPNGSSGGLMQQIFHGDSGGPSYRAGFVASVYSGGFWQYYVLPNAISGIHTSVSDDISPAYSTDTSTFAAARWICDNSGGVMIESYQKTSSGGRLAVAGQGTYLGAPTNVMQPTTEEFERWYYDSTTKQFVGSASGKCLDVQWNSSADGTPVWLWDCNTSPAQQWTLTDNGYIRNANGKCLTMASGRVVGSPLTISTCSDPYSSSFKQSFVTRSFQ